MSSTATTSCTKINTSITNFKYAYTDENEHKNKAKIKHQQI